MLTNVTFYDTPSTVIPFADAISLTGKGASEFIRSWNWKCAVRDLMELRQEEDVLSVYLSPSWVKYFLDIATVVASKSKDRTKVGCVLVNPGNKQILSTGFNGFCRDVADTPERYADRETKMDYVVHAEANAICFAAFSGMSTAGSYAFITLPPCHSCAKILKQGGISKVFYLEDNAPKPTQEIQDDWRKKTQLSLDILHEAGVRTYRCKPVNEHNDEELKLLVLPDVPPVYGTISGMDILEGIDQETRLWLSSVVDARAVSLEIRQEPEQDFMEHLNSKFKTNQDRMKAVRYLNTRLDEFYLKEGAYYVDRPMFVVNTSIVGNYDIGIVMKGYKFSPIVSV